MEFKLARCSGILCRTAAALFLTDQSAHPSPRLWLQPCCQRSHSEGDAHTRTRRHPARLPYDRCKPSSIGRSPLHPRPATHAKSTSIPARAKSFEGTVWKCVSKRLAGHTPFYVFHSNKNQKKHYFQHWDKRPTLAPKGTKMCFSFWRKNAAHRLEWKSFWWQWGSVNGVGLPFSAEQDIIWTFLIWIHLLLRWNQITI